MTKIKVLWNDRDTGERHSRQFETADEARGFIKGLRISKLYDRIGIRVADADGAYVKSPLATIFPEVPEKAAA